MSIKINYIEEPRLQFGKYFEHEDTKIGLQTFGPFGKNIDGLHPSEIKLGFIGTRETIADAKNFIEELGTEIQSEKVRKTKTKTKNQEELFEGLDNDQKSTRYEKMLDPDFIGFNNDSQFQSKFQINERWDRHIQPREIKSIIEIQDKCERIWKLVELFESHIESLATTPPKPTIIIVALTPEIIEEAHAVQIASNYYLNFRRALKARAMKWDIPLQLLQKRTATGKGSDLQDKATRAWNFCTAQYYKADEIPWKLISIEENVCLIGISFYVAQDVDDKLTMRASVAQAFDHLGQGLILRGDPFEWDMEKLGRSPHLTQKQASDLIQRTLNEYMKVRRLPPARVVIHKTSEFWGTDHPAYNELEGFYEGISAVFPSCETDFVALRQTGIRLFREGKYPPLRGTYFNIEDKEHFIYTKGYIPYLETSPAVHVPEPWQITQRFGAVLRVKF